MNKASTTDFESCSKSALNPEPTTTAGSALCEKIFKHFGVIDKSYRIKACRDKRKALHLSDNLSLFLLL